MDNQPDMNSSMNQSDLYQSSLLDPNSSLNLTSNHSMDSSVSNLSSVSELGSISSSLNSAGQEPMDCEVIGEVSKVAGSSGGTAPRPGTSTGSGSKSKKKKKRSKEHLEQEKREREARKAQQEAEKLQRREERERQAELSRQRKEEKRRKIEENQRARENKRVEKEKEAEEKKKQQEELKRMADAKKAAKDAEQELRKKERDEKKRAEDEKLAKKKAEEDEKRRKEQKVANKFTSFFTKLSPPEKQNPRPAKPTGALFMGPFEIQKDQTLANYIPEWSKEKFVMGAFDSEITHQDTDVLYLHEIRNKTRMPYKYSKRPANPVDPQSNRPEDDIIVEGSQGDKKTYRAKLLQFVENNRPAYFGTWRKTSRSVSGRRPFAKDLDQFDYDLDSDDEWEEEEKGEELKDSDSEERVDDEEEDNDDYEIDEFFVPHGHLSDDENQDEEYFEVEELPDGQRKRKMLTKEKLLIEERTKKLKSLVPKAIGCLFVENNDEFETRAKFDKMRKYRVVFVA